MGSPSGSCPAGSPAAAALGASEKGLHVDYDRRCLASTRPWWVPMSQRFSRDTTRCTAGSTREPCVESFPTTVTR